jgi:hypothetical protein
MNSLELLFASSSSFFSLLTGIPCVSFLHLGEALDWSLAVQRLRRMAQESGPCAKIDEIVACSREITKVTSGNT